MSSVLICDWKQEPLSPLFTEEVALVSEDEALYWTELEQCNVDKLETEPVSPNCKAEEDSLLDDLDNLEDLDEWIKQGTSLELMGISMLPSSSKEPALVAPFTDVREVQESSNGSLYCKPFSHWLEEKMLPMFDVDTTAVTPMKTESIKSVPDTQSLLKEFETVFDAVNHGTLTPPQSPPYEQPMLTTLEPLSAQPSNTVLLKDYTNVLVYTRPESIQLDYVVPTPQSNIAHELAVVDELVRTRAQDMVQWSSPSSPCSSNSNSDSSNFGDCSSDDPEWIPEPVEDEYPASSVPSKTRKRSKPYSRVPPEDKKVRKKEQNKNAATRYRMKKKAEVEEILSEERSLQNENEKVVDKINDLQREIKYLKGLMRDLFKAKGLIN